MIEHADAPKPHANCSVCSQLRDRERGLQVHGREDEDTFLPEIGARLKIVKYLECRGERRTIVERCPECATWYLYKCDYEYLATGSEEEQSLERLSDEQAARYLELPADD